MQRPLVDVSKDIDFLHKTQYQQKNKELYICAHILLNILNEFGKSDKMQGLPSYLFCSNVFDISKNTGA